MRLQDCHNFHDFRRNWPGRRLPGPIFNYIDGAADDEVTYRRNTAAFEDCDLVPNVLQGVREVDLSTIVPGPEAAASHLLFPNRTATPVPPRRRAAQWPRPRPQGTAPCSGSPRWEPRAWRRRGRISTGPQVYQFYFHKDRELNREMMARAKQAGVEAMMLTVDSITGGNRERDKRTGFAIPFRLNAAGVSQFAIKPGWGGELLNCRGAFRLPQLENHVDMGRGAMSISHYFTEMLDPSVSWDDVATMVQEWGGQFCLKGVMSVGGVRNPRLDGAGGQSRPPSGSPGEGAVWGDVGGASDALRAAWAEVSVQVRGRHRGECLPDLRVSTAPISTWKFCIDAVPHTVLGTNAGRVSCR